MIVDNKLYGNANNTPRANRYQIYELTNLVGHIFQNNHALKNICNL